MNRSVIGRGLCIFLLLGTGSALAADNPWNGSQPVERRVRCYADPESQDERFCSAINDGKVLLVRNLGGGGCIEGDNWRHDSRGIFVSRGCQGEFRYRAESDSLGKRDWEGEYVEVYCESFHGDEQFCAVSNRGVRLLRRLGDAGCEQGRGWRHTSRGIYVRKGCRGVFAVRDRADRP